MNNWTTYLTEQIARHTNFVAMHEARITSDPRHAAAHRTNANSSRQMVRQFEADLAKVR